MSPFRIVVIFLFVCITGIFFIPHLNVDLVPKDISPELTIEYSLANSSPEEVEQQVTAPLENAFSQLSQLKKITSQSFYDRGSIRLQFDDAADISMKKFELTTIMRNVHSRLPSLASYPHITQGEGHDKAKPPLMVYSVYGPNTPLEIANNTESILKKALAAVPGVSEVIVSGATGLQLNIEFDENALRTNRVTVEDIKRAVENETRTSFPGSIKASGGEQLFLKIKVTEYRDLKNVLIATKEGKVIKLIDVANIYVGEQEPTSHFRINGQPSVSIRIYVREGQNAMELVNHIKSTVSENLNRFPRGYHVLMEYDDSYFFSKELTKNYQRTWVSVVVLILLIMAFYRQWRYLVALLLFLIVSFSITILTCWFFGINIHLYTLAGISVSFGLMIDQGIIVLDYYRQFRNRKVFFTLVAASFTVMASLWLIFLLPEEDRKNLSDFVLVVSVSMITSLLASVIFIPGSYELLFGSGEISKQKIEKQGLRKKVKYFKFYFGAISILSRFRYLFTGAVILCFGIPIFLLPPKLGSQVWYNSTIGSDLYQETIRPQANRYLGGVLRLFIQNVFEKGNYREPTKTKLFVNAELPLGNTLAQMNYVMGKVDDYLSHVNGVDKFVTQIYSGQFAAIEISFKEEYEKSMLPVQLKTRLVDWSLSWAGVSWSIYGVGQGFNAGPEDEIPSYRILLKGYNFDELEKLTNNFASRLLNEKRIQNINTNANVSFDEKPGKEFKLTVDNYWLAQKGLSKRDMTVGLQNVSSNHNPDNFVQIGEIIYPVFFREKKASNFSRWELLHYHLGPMSNTKLGSSNAEITLEKTASVIHREDRQYLRVLSCEYYGPQSFGLDFLREMVSEMKTEMPPGYSVELVTNKWDRDKVAHQYFLIALLFLAIFIISAILFESLTQPFLVVATIPVSFIGLFLVFGKFEYYFDQGGYAAFILLGGLVANASIFIINDFNCRFIKGGKNYNRILLKTVVNRGRTILLTMMATCCGLIPFLTEGQNEIFWFALAAGTIGGLIASQFAIFLALPVWAWRNK